MSDQLAQVKTRHYCAGVVVRDGTVIAAAPILGWMVGRHVGLLIRWLKHKGELTWLDDAEDT